MFDLFADYEHSTDFGYGDLAIYSFDEKLYRIHSQNVQVMIGHIPSSIVLLHSQNNDQVQVKHSSDVLDILLHYLYPQRTGPDLGTMSFLELSNVIQAAHEWGLECATDCFLAQLFCFIPSPDIYSVFLLAGKYNHAPLFAAAAPYSVHFSTETLWDLGVNATLCMKWAIYRERLVNALTAGHAIAQNHAVICAHWRDIVVPALADKMGPPHGLLGLQHFAIEGYNTTGRLHEPTMQDVAMSVEAALPAGKNCCKECFEGWKGATFSQLASVCFPL
ncbi:hypothetical protein GYMLUDRAFT_62300 [Collybiopsis luxurians FD-317 M1]|uniref:Uncharacterized protein n=1 Tax=Collybiopsis luxurians FD-317 M1 TaxID=944289 RepID=A0A0D0BMF2_9AGAR|nr:hypothetical protein GYMLUDRAFT_62300 [Collybiopsis luxurians FD-317 M1]